MVGGTKNEHTLTAIEIYMVHVHLSPFINTDLDVVMWLLYFFLIMEFYKRINKK